MLNKRSYSILAESFLSTPKSSKREKSSAGRMRKRLKVLLFACGIDNSFHVFCKCKKEPCSHHGPSLRGIGNEAAQPLSQEKVTWRQLPVSLCAKCIKGWKGREILNNPRFLFFLTSTQLSTSLTYLHCSVCVTLICRSRKIILPKTSPPFEMLLRNRQTQLLQFFLCQVSSSQPTFFCSQGIPLRDYKYQ